MTHCGDTTAEKNIVTITVKEDINKIEVEDDKL